MHHVVQFGINIDDEAIKRVVEKEAVNAVIADLKNDVNKVFRDKYGDLKYYIIDTIDKAVAEYKDEIIEKAVEQVVQSIKKSKKYREALANVVEEIEK